MQLNISNQFPLPEGFLHFAKEQVVDHNHRRQPQDCEKYHLGAQELRIAHVVCVGLLYFGN